MKRKALTVTIAAIVALGLFGAAVYASPYWAVRELKEAARERDVDALLEHVDTNALRRNVRLAMGFKLQEQFIAPHDLDAKPAGPGASEAARALVDPMSDALTSPPLLMSMLIQGKPSDLMGGLQMAPLGTVAQAGEKAVGGHWDAAIEYVDWSTVLVASKSTPHAGNFILKRAGLMDWKLSGFRMPNQ